jgi:hypothetical protein
MPPRSAAASNGMPSIMDAFLKMMRREGLSAMN